MTVAQRAVPRLPPPFPSDLGLLEVRYEQWLNNRVTQALSDDDRISYHQTLAVPYEQWQRRIERAVSGILTPRSDRLTLWVEGPSRTGKSTFAIEVLLRVLHDTRENFGRVLSSAEAEDDINPVIAVKGSTGQHADFMRSLLGAVGLPERPTAERMLTSFGVYCRRHFVRVLLIDDVHVTASREAGVENFYKRVLDIVPCIIFTAVDFNQSPLPRPAFASSRRADTLKQLWNRALHEDPHADPDDDPAWIFVAEDSETSKGRLALGGAIVEASRALRLNDQGRSDLTGKSAVAAMVALHRGSVGAILSHILQAAASAVGQSERVGSQELRLTIMTEADQA